MSKGKRKRAFPRRLYILPQNCLLLVSLRNPTSFGKVVVTGGAGFIGSHIVDRLLEQQDNTVVVLDDFSTGSLENLKHNLESSRLQVLKMDICDDSGVDYALKDASVVFHEAALSAGDEEGNSEKAFHVNVEGTRKLLKACIAKNVERFVYASSSAVYGTPPKLPVLEEETVPSPTTVTGRTKLAAGEDCLKAWKDHSLKTTILRYFDVYGPRSHSEAFSKLVRTFCEKLSLMEGPVIRGSGNERRDPTYVDDVVEATIAAASSSESPGRIYNVSGGRSAKVEEIGTILSELLLGPNMIIPFEYHPFEKSQIPEIFCDISKARRELKFEPRTTLREGLKRYISWFGSGHSSALLRDSN